MSPHQIAQEIVAEIEQAAFPFRPDSLKEFERRIREAIFACSNGELAEKRRRDWPAMVREFRLLMGVLVSDAPTLIDPAKFSVHERLLAEELRELKIAETTHDLPEIADAIADTIYILLGLAAEMGLPMLEIFAEVHRTNMAKVDADGNPIIDANGKIRKPRGWQPPDIAGILERAK